MTLMQVNLNDFEDRILQEVKTNGRLVSKVEAVKELIRNYAKEKVPHITENKEGGFEVDYHAAAKK